MKESKSEVCSSCGSLDLKQVVLIENVPTHCNLLWDKKSSAVDCPKGDIQLNFCNSCGHLYNQLFDDQLMAYSQNYENTLGFSPVFQEYSIELVKRLIQTYDLQGKAIIEIGCGKGDFLKMICEHGNNQGYGFDKSYDPTIENQEALNSVEFVQDFYSEKYSDYPSDIVISRHVLEHIDDPQAFVSSIRNIAGNDKNKIFYFEVPNALFTLRDLGIWDLIYEHCSYFSATSITRLFEGLNFKVLDVRENYMGQFLSIEASTSNRPEDFKPYIDVDDIKGLVEEFATSFNQKINEWRQKLNELKSQGKKTVVWGGGSKGVSFLNFLQTAELVEFIVDINPRKSGKFVAGTGQEYIMPERLTEINPDVVIIMNPVYKEEIANTLKEMNLSSKVLVA